MLENQTKPDIMGGVLKAAFAVAVVLGAVALVVMAFKPTTIHVDNQGRLLQPEERWVPVQPNVKPLPYPYRPGNLDNGSLGEKGAKNK